MKIGILGNLANNGFSILRHLRGLGADAYLLLYSTDGVGENGHFSVEADTWAVEEWSPYVIRTKIPDHAASALAGAKRALGLQMVTFKRLLFSQDPIRGFGKKDVEDMVRPFDFLIGSGIAPGLLFAAGVRPLDIFFPYSVGIEYLGSGNHADSKLSTSRSPFLKSARREIERNQAEGIKATGIVISSDSVSTRQALKGMGVFGTPMFVPQVFVRLGSDEAVSSPLLTRVSRWASSFDFIVYHGARQFWKEKRNHFLLEALRTVAESSEAKVGLLIADYGVDAKRAQSLASELGLDGRIFWFPKCQRREVYEMLRISDVAVGEFQELRGTMFGSTGWEALATGTPLIQGYRFGPGEFRIATGAEEPPILRADSARDIERQLLRLISSPEQRQHIGALSLNWFQKWGGKSVAKKWLTLATPSSGNSQD